ncbi:MFS transporter [Luteimonas granuli]|uniref:MFS transporter n=1 Tax=Luteimonas granuli TaxID=1176533 RepID=A0A518N2A7_9GAMM|nr:MFS transporter [Luteimonas granuli]QDW66071.1 MFS transporter [Luteimonas granuli]
MNTSMKLYHRLVKADRSGQDPTAQQATARNALRQVAANSLQEIGDQVVNAKTVLPWLFASLGVPPVLIGLLVPIRESGSMLPQAALTPMIRRMPRRRTAWVAGAMGQALATAAMAFAAAGLSGTAAGLVILGALTVFALSRSLCSLAGKDVMGRSVPKGERGQISGISTVLSGAVAVTLGLGIRLLGGDEVSSTVLAALLGAAALAWTLAAAVFAGIREPADADAGTNADVHADADVGPQTGDGRGGWLRSSWRLLSDDAPFRHFVLARTLLLVSALSPPFVVALAARAGGVGLDGLGPFVLAQGLASLVGGRWFGSLADRSSKRLMVGGAAFASMLVLLFLAALAVPGMRAQWWLYPLVYLLLVLTHTAVRVARKTYVVDMAEGDRRTEYVAVANTAMGMLLLVVGGVSGALAALGTEVALAFLALLGLAGVQVSRRLPEVSHHG